MPKLSGRSARLLIGGSVAAAIVLRLASYFTGRALWYDEAMLSLNLILRDWVGLLLPVDSHQGAPIVFLWTDKAILYQSAPVAFLWTEKAMLTVFGIGELALRAFPLLGGIAACVLFALLARRLFSPAAAVAATALCAFSPRLIYYSNEVKQYSVDVLCATALCACALWQRGPLTWRGAAAWSIGGIFAILFSHPAAILLALIGLYLAFVSLTANGRRALGPLFLTGSAWTVTLATLYVLVLRNLGDNEYFQTYWAAGYLPRGGIPEAVLWFATAVPRGLSFLALGFENVPLGGAIACMVLAGAVVCFRMRPLAISYLLCTPLIAALVMAGLRVYPFSGRMILYLAPFVFCLLTFCAEWAFTRSGKTAVMGIAVMTSIAGTGAAISIGKLLLVTPAENVHRTAIRRIAQSFNTGDRLILSGCTHECSYYMIRYGIPASAAIVQPASEPPPAFPPARAVWIYRPNGVWQLDNCTRVDGKPDVGLCRPK